MRWTTEPVPDPSGYANDKALQSTMRVMFLIHSMNRGGAERQLLELVRGMSKGQYEIILVTFYDHGAWSQEAGEIDGVRAATLGRRGRWDLLVFPWRLWRMVRRFRPRIMHGYMEVPNALCLLMGRLIRAKVVWGLRRSQRDFSDYDWAERWSFRLGAWLSRFADLIIVNSDAGRQHYAARGYCGRRMVVISNGIDTDRFRPNSPAGQRVRGEWGIDGRAFLIGLVARLHPMKGHPTFLRAASLLARERDHVRFVCVGAGSGQYREELYRLAREMGLAHKVIWAGARDDMTAVYSALDTACSSSSYGEGFSNVVGEAMACGVPCTVTDIGDSAWIVGDAGFVVPPKDPLALVEAWRALLGMSKAARAALGGAARERIVAKFSTRQMVERTEMALEELLCARST